MTTLVPYIRFDRTAREALKFYERCFGGSTVQIMPLSSAPMPCPPGMENDVLHAEFHAGGVHFMCTDCGHEPLTDGNRASFNLMVTDEAEQTRLFNALAEGGTVTLPLADTFWGARFGMLVDRFGIRWMLNCEKQK